MKTSIKWVCFVLIRYVFPNAAFEDIWLLFFSFLPQNCSLNQFDRCSYSFLSNSLVWVETEFLKTWSCWEPLTLFETELFTSSRLHDTIQYAHLLKIQTGLLFPFYHRCGPWVGFPRNTCGDKDLSAGGSNFSGNTGREWRGGTGMSVGRLPASGRWCNAHCSAVPSEAKKLVNNLRSYVIGWELVWRCYLPSTFLLPMLRFWCSCGGRKPSGREKHRCLL